MMTIKVLLLLLSAASMLACFLRLMSTLENDKVQYAMALSEGSRGNQAPIEERDVQIRVWWGGDRTKPACGRKLRVYSDGSGVPMSWALSYTSVSDSNGVSIFRSLRRGSYFIEDVGGSDGLLSVEEYDRGHADFHIRDDLQIQGDVTDDAGRPVSGATVFAVRNRGGSPMNCFGLSREVESVDIATSDRDGRFIVRGLVRHSYELFAKTDNMWPLCSSSADSLERPYVKLVVSQFAGTIQGQITNAANADSPVAFALVRLGYDDAPMTVLTKSGSMCPEVGSMEMGTDLNGIFSFRGIPPGVHRLAVAGMSGLSGWARDVFVSAGETSIVDIRLQTQPIIRCRVDLGSSVDLPVIFTLETGSRLLNIEIDTYGQSIIQDVPAVVGIPVSLEAKSLLTGKKCLLSSVVLKAGEILDESLLLREYTKHKISMEAPKLGEVVGRIRSANLLDHIELYLRSINDQAILKRSTAPEVHVGNIPVGSYAAFAWVDGYGLVPIGNRELVFKDGVADFGIVDTEVPGRLLVDLVAAPGRGDDVAILATRVAIIRLLRPNGLLCPEIAFRWLLRYPLRLQPGEYQINVYYGDSAQVTRFVIRSGEDTPLSLHW